MPLVLGSEWGHNLAHAASAHWVGKPVDAIRIVWGMPLLVYYDVNDQHVTAKQHIVRALGGPAFNLSLLPFVWLIKEFSKDDSMLKDLGNFLFATNAFIGIGGFLPIPGVDGGPILKWSLVERGYTIQEADNAIRKVNGVLGTALGGALIIAAKKKHWVWTGIFGMFAVTAFGIATGLIIEQE
jgi:Zn-dependent protease